MSIRQKFYEKFGDKIYGEKPFGALKTADEIADFFISEICKLAEEEQKIHNYSPLKGRLTYDPEKDARLMELLSVANEMGIDPHNLIATHNSALSALISKVKEK